MDKEKRIQELEEQLSELRYYFNDKKLKRKRELFQRYSFMILALSAFGFLSEYFSSKNSDDSFSLICFIVMCVSGFFTWIFFYDEKLKERERKDVLEELKRLSR